MTNEGHPDQPKGTPPRHKPSDYDVLSHSRRRRVPRSDMSHPSPNPTPGSDHDAEVIHLTLVIPPVRRLLAFYDQLLAGGQPAIELLDQAVIELKELPTVPGRLGRDIALIADGGRGANRNDIVGSLERLRQIAAMDPPEPATDAVPARRTKTKARPKTQATLPGMA